MLKLMHSLEHQFKQYLCTSCSTEFRCYYGTFTVIQNHITFALVFNWKGYLAFIFKSLFGLATDYFAKSAFSLKTDHPGNKLLIYEHSERLYTGRRLSWIKKTVISLLLCCLIYWYMKQHFMIQEKFLACFKYILLVDYWTILEFFISFIWFLDSFFYLYDSILDHWLFMLIPPLFSVT